MCAHLIVQVKTSLHVYMLVMRLTQTSPKSLVAANKWLYINILAGLLNLGLVLRG